MSGYLTLQERGSVAFDYGNNLRGQAKEAGLENAFDFPGFVPAILEIYFVRAKGPLDGLHYPVMKMISLKQMKRF